MSEQSSTSSPGAQQPRELAARLVAEGRELLRSVGGG
jgi:hypothetical protein